MDKKFPFPGEVLSENHQFRTSKPPYPRILDSRREKRTKCSWRHNLWESRILSRLPSRHKFPILARREKRNKKPPRGSKRQSLRIENSEPPDPLVTNSQFSRGEGNKKPPRHSKITQPLRIENSEPSALSSINFKFSRGEEREDRSVQDAPEATPLVRVVCSVVW